jgi:hypothetical protein
MKTKTILYALCIAVTLCSCGMQKFSIGETSGATFNQDKRKAVYLFWGIVPIGRKQTFTAYADAKGYEITTRYNGIDFLATLLTGGIFGMKTVKYEPHK